MVIAAKKAVVLAGEGRQAPDLVPESFFSSRFLDRFDYTIIPGFTDAHVHLREPGFSYKETIASGTAAAARGGYTAVCAMPNLSPSPDCTEALDAELELIERDARVPVYPYGTITAGEAGRELSDMAALAPRVIGFSDDGHGVADAGLMREAMTEAKRLRKPIVAHCEDMSLRQGGVVSDCALARRLGLPVISPETEWRQLERDLELAAQTGCAYHMCHLSTAMSARLMGEAKRGGLDVTCETAPHYLLLDTDALRDEGRFLMNPPLATRADREALVEAFSEGVIDMAATDHAPHSAEEKGRGLLRSAMGVVGLETAFPLLYTYLVRPGLVTMERLLDSLVTRPERRFGLRSERCWGVWALDERYSIDAREFLSKGRATPFEGMSVYGLCLLTVCGGRAVYRYEEEKRNA